MPSYFKGCLLVSLAICAFTSLTLIGHVHARPSTAFGLAQESNGRTLQSLTSPPPQNLHTPPSPIVNNFEGYYLQYVYVSQKNQGVWKVVQGASVNYGNNIITNYTVVNYKGSFVNDLAGTLFTIESALSQSSTALVGYGDNFFLHVAGGSNLYVCKANGKLVALPNGYGVASCKFTITWKHQCITASESSDYAGCLSVGDSIMDNYGGQKLFMSSQLVGSLPNAQVLCPYSGSWNNYDVIVG